MGGLDRPAEEDVLDDIEARLSFLEGQSEGGREDTLAMLKRMEDRLNGISAQLTQLHGLLRLRKRSGGGE